MSSSSQKVKPSVINRHERQLDSLRTESQSEFVLLQSILADYANHYVVNVKLDNSTMTTLLLTNQKGKLKPFTNSELQSLRFLRTANQGTASTLSLAELKIDSPDPSISMVLRQKRHKSFLSTLLTNGIVNSQSPEIPSDAFEPLIFKTDPTALAMTPEFIRVIEEIKPDHHVEFDLFSTHSQEFIDPRELILPAPPSPYKGEGEHSLQQTNPDLLVIRYYLSLLYDHSKHPGLFSDIAAALRRRTQIPTSSSFEEDSEPGSIFTHSRNLIREWRTLPTLGQAIVINPEYHKLQISKDHLYYFPFPSSIWIDENDLLAMLRFATYAILLLI